MVAEDERVGRSEWTEYRVILHSGRPILVEKSSETSLEREAAIEEGLEHQLEASARRARHYFDSARAPNTVKAYKSDLTDFETWAKVDAGGVSTLPASPETVAVYIGDLAGRGLKAATINRRLTAISVMHKAARVESPTEDQQAIAAGLYEALAGRTHEHLCGINRRGNMVCWKCPAPNRPITTGE